MFFLRNIFESGVRVWSADTEDMQYLRGTYLPFHKIHCQVALRIKIVCNSFIGRIMEKNDASPSSIFFFISLGNFTSMTTTATTT